MDLFFISRVSAVECKNRLVMRKKGNLKESGGSIGHKRRVSFDPLALLLDASLEGELELVMRTAEQVSCSELRLLPNHSVRVPKTAVSVKRSKDKLLSRFPRASPPRFPERMVSDHTTKAESAYNFKMLEIKLKSYPRPRSVG